MPLVLTRDFGELSYEPSAEWFFPRGLPGFEDQNRFVVLEREGIAPIVLLQSVSTAALCFLAVSAWVADPVYRVGMTQDDLEALGLSAQPQPGDGTVCLVILSSSGGGFTANLLAPVVVNLQTRTALQAVRTDSKYSHRYPLRIEEASPCS